MSYADGSITGKTAWNEGKKCKSKSAEVKQKHSIALLQFHSKKKIIRETKVLNFIADNGAITTKQIREIIGTSSKRSSLRIILSLIDQNKIKKEYRGPRNIVYTFV
jgi:predicted HTH transcriptional regulator